MSKNIGGQAIIEGVLMRNKNKVAISILKNKKIKTKILKIKPKHKLLKLPFIRGLIILIETLTIGIKALNYSADQQTSEKEKTSSRWRHNSFT